jgi:O-antigen ligase
MSPSRRSRRGGGAAQVLPAWIPRNGFAIGTVALLVLAVLIGGASRDHVLRVSLLELAALPVLGLGLLRLYDQGRHRTHGFALAIAAAVLAVPLIQLIPLPPGLWQALPGREQPALALEIAGIEPGWVPLSLAPDLTLRNLLALLPPLAMFVAALTVEREQARGLIRVILFLTLASLVLAGVQIGSGSEAFYPWRVTDRGDVVGFFANRNHLATLCLIALPFAALFAGRAARRGPEGRSALFLWSAFLAVLTVALVAIQSRMGVILAGPVAVASLIVGRQAAGRGVGGPKLLAGLVAGVVAVGAVAWVGSDALLARFYSDSHEQRLEGWPVAFEAAQAHLPVGAGMGSFNRIYRSVEPLEQVDETYFNQAHNDYLETLLEAGWLAVGVVVAFLIWFGRRLGRAWRNPDGADPAALASAVAIVAVMAHSAVDYPLRTITLTVVFALCCALLERRSEGVRRRRGS